MTWPGRAVATALLTTAGVATHPALLAALLAAWACAHLAIAATAPTATRG